MPLEEIAAEEWEAHTDGILPEALAIGEHDGTVVGIPSIVSTPPGDAGQDPLDHHPVGPGRMQSLQIEHLCNVHVDAAEVDAGARPLVEAPVKRC